MASMKTRIGMTKMDEAIRANEILAKLRPTAAQELAEGATQHRFERGEVICHEQEPVTRFWLVLGGEIKLVKYMRTSIHKMPTCLVAVVLIAMVTTTTAPAAAPAL